jgi:hypothetical protein
MRGMQALFAAFAGLAASMANAASDFGRAHQHGKRRRRNKERWLREQALKEVQGGVPGSKLAKKAAKGRLGLIHFGGSRPVGLPGKYAFGAKRTTPALSQPTPKPLSHRQRKKAYMHALVLENKALKSGGVAAA